MSVRAMLAAAVLLTALPPYRLTAAQCPDGTPPPCRGASRGATPPAPTSVAVLYFDNIARDSNDAYLADGLTEELIARLGQVERLQVKSRTAVQRYRGRTDDPAVMGRALGVAHLVSGSVRRGGGRLRVTVELTRATTGLRVWGSTYERGTDDLMAVESEIAQSIAEGVGGRLAPDERRVVASRPTADAEAYDHFLRANHLIAERTTNAARRAVTEYRSAVRADPRFARAWGLLAMAYALFVDWGWPMPGMSRDSLIASGMAAADRAVALDSLSTDAWLGRGLVALYIRPNGYEQSARAYQRAVTLDPRNAEAWHMYGGLLGWMGNDSAAVAAFQRALALDPTRTITLDNLGLQLVMERRLDDAARWLDSGIAVDPSAYFAHVDRASLAFLQGDTTRARLAVEATVRWRPPDYVATSESVVAALEAARGDTAAARARLERAVRTLSDPSRPDYSQGSSLALGFVRAGDRGRALDVLERVTRDICLAWVMRDPGFDPIRGDPRFQRVFNDAAPARVRR